jgi:uncharacterized membrane protein
MLGRSHHRCGGDHLGEGLMPSNGADERTPKKADMSVRELWEKYFRKCTAIAVVVVVVLTVLVEVAHSFGILEKLPVNVEAVVSFAVFVLVLLSLKQLFTP